MVWPLGLCLYKPYHLAIMSSQLPHPVWCLVSSRLPRVYGLDVLPLVLLGPWKCCSLRHKSLHLALSLFSCKLLRDLHCLRKTSLLFHQRSDRFLPTPTHIICNFLCDFQPQSDLILRLEPQYTSPKSIKPYELK